MNCLISVQFMAVRLKRKTNTPWWTTLTEPQSLQTWWDECDCMHINMSHKTVMCGGASLAETSGDVGEAQLARD